MSEITLKYGCNPHQAHARVAMAGKPLPLRVLNGSPSMINILDALAGWQLVRELSRVTDRTAAASFKHVSPAGAAIDGAIPDQLVRSQFLDAEPNSRVARAYVRARAGDRMSSFGDAASVSDTVDLELAQVLKREVSDLIVAPAYEPEALNILRQKKKGSYVILEIDPEYVPPGRSETRDVFGLTVEQDRDDSAIDTNLFARHGQVPQSVAETLTVGTVALKYTQSNSVCVAHDGQLIGMAAGQQSRIHCTRLACEKAEKWMLQQHPRVLGLPFRAGLGRPERTNAVDQFVHWDRLSHPEQSALRETLTADCAPLTKTERSEWFASFTDLCLSSDAFIPFRDNIDRAAHTGITYVAHAGGAVRDSEVHAAAEQHGMQVLETGIRCFTH